MRNLMAIVALLAVLCVACGSSEQPEVGSSSEESPTPTAAPTRNPAIPTPTPPITSLSSAAYKLMDLGPIKRLPPELAPDSQPLPLEEVTALWDDFLRGTRMQTSHRGNDGFLHFDFAFCDDHRGRIKVDEGNQVGLDFSMRWELRDAMARWNSILIAYPEVIAGHTSTSPPVGIVPDEHVGRGLFFVSEAGPHYIQDDFVAVFSELKECPA